jgi:hypothetical protein
MVSLEGRSEDPFAMLQIARGAHPGQGDAEVFFVLIRHPYRRAPVFESNPATIPAVGGLNATTLQSILNQVITGFLPEVRLPEQVASAHP